MARSNLNNQAKRKRELAKKDKRAAKDQKRAMRKAEARAARAGVVGMSAPASSAAVAVAQSAATSNVKSLAAARFVRRMNKTPGA
jgi:hypothetical protein